MLVSSAAWRKANKEKIKANNAAWRAANPERCKELAANWAAANPERKLEIHAVWRAANPEQVKERSSSWRRANPEARRISAQNRRARKLVAGGVLSKGLSAKLFALQKGKCPCCKQPLGNDYHLDHIMPLALGGSNSDDNMQLLRQRCNLQKRAKHPIDFMQQRGNLL